MHAPRYISVPSCPLRLRPIGADDEEEWNEVRWRNDEWLRPWEAGDPMHGAAPSYNQWMQQQRRNAQEGRGMVFVMEYQMRIVGQISLGAIDLGSMRTGVVGYWVDRRYAGRGFAPMAVSLLADWAFADPSGPRLHRLEIALLPENERSRSVARKVGCHYEGIRRKYMFVNGRWRDHETYSLLAEDRDGGFADRLMAARLTSRHAKTQSVQS
ncbi:GNAT family N-acetyltransferase [Bifidobacterium leontopitheci]